jgi:hypothetical protein
VPQNILVWLRRNAIALLALFIALGGTSYAALTLPKNSVGARQIRNGSITPVKFDSSAIGGSVRHWAYISAAGTIVGGSSGAQVASGGTGNITLDWHAKFSSNCGLLVTPEGGIATPGGGSVASSFFAQVVQSSKTATNVLVGTRDSSGNSIAAPFYVAVVC